MNNRQTIVPTIILWLMILSSCVREDFLEGGTDVDDGPATVTMNIAYNSLVEGLTTRGVDANLDFELRDITVVFYEEYADETSGKPATNSDNTPLVYRYFVGSDYKTQQEERVQTTTEHHTRHAAMSIKDVMPGNYRIYALANVDGIEELSVEAIKDMSEKTLREHKIQWDGQLTGTAKKDPRTYNIPDAMFGYFHLADMSKTHEAEYKAEEGGELQDVIHHNPSIWNYNGGTSALSFNPDSKNGVREIKDNRAPVITVKGNTTIHAWMKRTISRLTVGYDGSQLNRGVEIYIKSVHIKNAVSTCLLGHDNQAGGTQAISSSDGTTVFVDDNLTDNRLNIVYSISEGATGAAISRTTPAFPRASENIQTRDSNGGWNTEWYNYVHGSPEAYSSSNSSSMTLDPAAPVGAATPETLYFMENLQGKDTNYNEEQYKKGEYPKSYHADQNDPDSWAMDKKPNGTYIEVEAYYNNTNKRTKGTIKYRFMLGQNVTDDFNAERNRHYKLIMSFRGDANDVDWHIEYEPEPQGSYFRIPYNLDDDDADYAYADSINKEYWYTNENWKQSYIWYAYDEAHNPIAEICKELIYIDTRTNGYNMQPEKNNATRKFYQVVTVYPIKENGETDLHNGIIAQVLACDTDEPGKEHYTTKVDGAKISMYYRYETNSKVSDTTKSKYGNVVIGSNELTIAIATCKDLSSHENYLYVKYDKETKELSLIEEPLNIKLETRPYKVKDYDGHTYPIVKIGASYWFRENLRTEKLCDNGDYCAVNKDECEEDCGPYSGGDGCVYFNEGHEMYKTLNGDSDGSKYGFLYNYAAIVGSEEYDPFLIVKSLESDYQPKAGDHAALVQFENDVTTTTVYSEWQITPKGWHITEAGESLLYNGVDDTKLFGNKWYDHQYLLDYLASDMFRAVRDKDNLKWPNHPNHDQEIKQRNLSGLSILAIPADGTSSYVNYDWGSVDEAPSNLTGLVVPYWTDFLIFCECEDYYDEGLYLYACPPYFEGNQRAKEFGDAVLICEERMSPTHYHQEISKQYLPVRPVRHSYKKGSSKCPEGSYQAQSWDTLQSLWTPSEGSEGNE